MIAEELKLVITAEVDRAVHDLKTFNRTSDESKDVLKGLGKSVLAFAVGMAGAAISIQTVIKFMSDGVKEYYTMERAQARLNAALRATAGSAGMMADELDNMSTALSRLTGMDDEAITESQALMLTFNKIGREVFPRAIEAAADLSVMLGTDMRSASMQLGKALQEPVEGMQALRRAGIQFNDSQEKLIKGLVESGNLLKAQEYILSVLEKKLGGTAKAMGETAAGAADKLKLAFDHLKEAQGAMLIKDTQGVVPWLTAVINGAVDARRAINDAAKALDALRKGQALSNIDSSIEGLMKERRTLESQMGAMRAQLSRTGATTSPVLEQFAAQVAEINKALEVLIKRQERVGVTTETPEGVTPLQSLPYREAAAAAATAVAIEAETAARKAYVESLIETTAQSDVSYGTDIDNLQMIYELLSGLKPVIADTFESGTLAVSDYASELELAKLKCKGVIDATGGVNKVIEKQAEILLDLSGSVRDVFSAIGESLVTGAEGWQSFGLTIRNTIASILDSLGQQMLAVGLAKLALPLLGPGASFAAAAAAFVAAGMIRAMPMAEGGVVTGPTHALIGEKGPEAVIPLDKMRGLGTTIIVQGNVMKEREMYRQADRWRQGAYAGY
jgi:hypothetical protein